MALYYEPLGPIAQLVEHCADNAGVTGSIPVGPTMLVHGSWFMVHSLEVNAMNSKQKTISSYGAVAQLGEHLLCKQGVRGSIPLSSTNLVHSNEFIVHR